MLVAEPLTKRRTPTASSKQSPKHASPVTSLATPPPTQATHALGHNGKATKSPPNLQTRKPFSPPIDTEFIAEDTLVTTCEDMQSHLQCAGREDSQPASKTPLTVTLPFSPRKSTSKQHRIDTAKAFQEALGAPYASKDFSPVEGYPTPHAQLRAGSSSLSPPPSSYPNPESPASTNAKKRKRAPSNNEVHRRSFTPAAASSRSSSQEHADTLPRPRASRSVQARSTSTSSLSELSATPALPSDTASQRPISVAQKDAPPTSSLTALASTPPAPDVQIKYEGAPIADSQESEELSDDAIYEKEKIREPSTSFGSFCAKTEETDSDSDLPSLDVLTSRGKPSAATKAVSQNAFRTSTAASQRKVKHDVKFSLQSLVKDNKRDEERLERLQKTQAELDGLEAAASAETNAGEASNDMESAALAAAMKFGGDEEGSTKVKLAMQRQELLDYDITWDFFDMVQQLDPSPCPAFPINTIDRHAQLSYLSDATFREQAFRTGFACELMLKAESIPSDLIKWLWKAALYEDSEDLQHCYLQTFQACVSHHNCQLNAQDIQDPLINAGATAEALNPSQLLTCSRQPLKDRPRAVSPLVSRLLNTCRIAVKSLGTETLAAVIGIFLRLGIDRAVNTSHEILPQVRAAVAECIQALLARKSNTHLEGVIRDMLTTVTHPVLQNRLLSAIPDTSSCTLAFKRQLALCFFHKFSDGLGNQLLDGYTVTERIVRRLKTDKTFDITNDGLDWRSMAAAIAILNIAIGPGFGNAQPEELDDGATHQQRARELEKTFNAHVDVLSDAVNGLYTQINDHGANHMVRSSAKSSLQNLHFRLQHGVRTRPRQRRRVLGAAISTQEKLTFGATIVAPQKKKEKAHFDVKENQPAKLRQVEKQSRNVTDFLDKRKKRLSLKSPLSAEVG